MRVGFRPISQQRRRSIQVEVPRLNTPNSCVFSQKKTPETKRNQLLQETFVAYETNTAQLITQNFRLINNPDEVTNKLTSLSQKFTVFQNTVNRLCGNSLAMTHGRRPGLVSGANAIKSALTPFLNSYSEFNQRILDEWRNIYRKNATEAERAAMLFKGRIQNIAIDPEDASNIYLFIGSLKECFDTIFQRDPAQGQSKLNEIVYGIGECIQSADYEEFKRQISYLCKNSLSWIIDYNSFIESRNEFQEILNEFLSKLEMQECQPTQRSQGLPETRPLTALSSPQYIPGMSLDEIIENGASILEKEQPDFFNDLREAVRKFTAESAKEICEQKNEISKLLIYKKLFESIVQHAEVGENNDLNEITGIIIEKLDSFNVFEKENNRLREENAKLAKIADDATKEMNEYKLDNERISKINADQNDRYGSFLAKMAVAIGSEAKEDSLLKTLESRRNNKENDDDSELHKLMEIVGESGDKATLLESVAEFKSFFVNNYKMENNVTLKQIIEAETKTFSKLRDLLAADKRSIALVVDEVVQLFTRKEKENTNTRNALVGIVSKVKGSAAAKMELNDLIVEISNGYSQSDPLFSNEGIHKIFAPVLELVETTSKTDAAVYLPEVSYFFILLHKSIQEMKKFTTDLDELFDKFEFKLPQKGTPEYEKVKKCCTALTARLRAIEPSQMHSVVFHTLSRLVVFIEALSNAL